MGRGKWPVKWEGTAVFGEQLVFAQRLLLGMDDVSIFPLKGTLTQDPQQRQKGLCFIFFERERHEHTVFSKDITSQLSSLPVCRSTPTHLSSSQRLTLLQKNGNLVCFGVCVS